MTTFRMTMSKGRQDECGPERLLSSLLPTFKLSKNSYHAL